MDIAKRPFGKSGKSVPIVGIGTWEMEHAEKESIEAIRRAVDEGATHVDTAELYGKGRVEDLVGKALAGIRRRVFLVSKVMPSNADYRGTIAACERSLARLGTSYLDCYLLHWKSETPLAETFSAFDKLVADGKILSFGVSNFGVGDMEEAIKICGEGRIACNQVLYHLKERAIEYDLIPYCSKHNIAVVAYSPYGSGDFPIPRSTGGKILQQIADKRQATPRQIALAFLLNRHNLFAIPKSSNVAHLLENVRSAAISLTKEEAALIDRSFPAIRKRRLPTI